MADRLKTIKELEAEKEILKRNLKWINEEIQKREKLI